MNKYMPEGFLSKGSRNYEYSSSADGLHRALLDGAIVEAPVVLCDHKMNLHVRIGALTGIIPKEEVCLTKDGEQLKDIAILTRVGKTVSFKVTGFEQKGDTVYPILSRREAQRECLECYIKALAPGDIIPARVTHVESFGAFVDIGCGIISLLSIDSISVSRIAHPEERISVGDCLYTVVKSIDDRGRVFVSMRELLGNWEENAARFTEGQTVRGIVRSVESYGIFVELTPNLAGLAEYRDNVKTGQCAAVYIKSIIPEKMKIKLIIIDHTDSSRLKTPIEYFVDTDKISHINSWTYSPTGSNKIIESIF